jgi:drug/metabolite transporter (DMT)-like permease
VARARWGGLTVVFIAAYTVIDGYAVKVLLISPVLVDCGGNALRIPVMLPFALRDPAAFKAACRAQWRASLVIAVLGPLSYIMVLYAVRMAPLSHVAPAREVSMLFAALAGGTLLGESDWWMRLAGAASIAAGVVALALALGRPAGRADDFTVLALMQPWLDASDGAFDLELVLCHNRGRG